MLVFGLLTLLSSSLLVCAQLHGPKFIDETTRWTKCKPANQSIYDFQMETLEGEFTDLSQYKGQVLLVINVATFCAYTQQYTDFNPLIEKNRANGDEFTILAFPCNQFYLQGTLFPMFIGHRVAPYECRSHMNIKYETMGCTIL